MEAILLFIIVISIIGILWLAAAKISAIIYRDYIKSENEFKELYGDRIDCVNCKYCEKFDYWSSTEARSTRNIWKYYSGNYRNTTNQLIPKYCRFLKKSLQQKYDLKCQIKDPGQAMRENKRAF